MRSPSLVDLVALGGVILLAYAALNVAPALFALIVGAALVVIYVVLETR